MLFQENVKLSKIKSVIGYDDEGQLLNNRSKTTQSKCRQKKHQHKYMMICKKS